ncbi:MAG: serine--tRNA ligase [Bacteroides sp.]|jgi:serine--tRNA ligase
MITLKRLREDSEQIIAGLERRGLKVKETIKELLAQDASRRELQTRLGEIQQKLNQFSKEFGALMAQGNKEGAEQLRQTVQDLKEKAKQIENELEERAKAFQEKLVLLPNVPHVSVPTGKNAEDNLVVRTEGGKPKVQGKGLPHWEIATKLDLIDFELGVKVTGAGFPVYKGYGARLQRALINFFLDENTKAGYLEIEPPIMVNAASAYATGQLPDKDGQMYYASVDDFYMIPTAEVPVTNLYRDSVVEEKELPIRMTAYTPCFRREAGSYGKDVRGLNRLHQFDKVELVCLEHPTRSYDRLEEMVQHVEGLLQKLELPYRVLKLCTGDMSFTSALTYDLEVYSIGQDKWLEVSSVSNFEDFQANRLSLRYKRADDKKNELLHTLNGSSLALPRVVAALLEDHQSEQGIMIPKALQPYMGCELIPWK